MIVHPTRERSSFEICGGRLLTNTFDLVGAIIPDDNDKRRNWSIQGFYAPIEGRALAGVRAKVRDSKDFTSFINQRDLEVLLGMAEPGDYCKWLGSDYVSPFDREWVGFCMDEEDLRDDLYEREMLFRMHQQDMTGSPYLPTGLELSRRIHRPNGLGTDVEELLYLRLDYDVETGAYPDLRLETVTDRWTSIEKETLLWQRV